MSKILYKLVKNNNSKSAAYGKWYARAVSKETLTFREFIEHVIRKAMRHVYTHADYADYADSFPFIF